MYTIEMAYAHMRSLQELANRSRAHQPQAARRADEAAARATSRRARKR